jgi:DNA-binding PadR family transcriptional regulator
MSEPQLDHTTALVLDALLDGFDKNLEMHGWRIMQRVGRSGPRVYRSLDKLEEWGWVETWWEPLPPGENRPRKRYYRIAADRVEAARSRLMAERGHAKPALRPKFGFTVPRSALAR